MLKLLLLLAFVSCRSVKDPVVKYEPIVPHKKDNKKKATPPVSSDNKKKHKRLKLLNKPFISKWFLGAGDILTLPLLPAGEYNFTV